MVIDQRWAAAGSGPGQQLRLWAHLNSCWRLCTRKLISAYYSFIDLERVKGWVDLVGWPAADGLPTWVVTRQLQVGRRTGKVRQPKTDVLPLSQRHQLSIIIIAVFRQTEHLTLQVQNDHDGVTIRYDNETFIVLSKADSNQQNLPRCTITEKVTTRNSKTQKNSEVLEADKNLWSLSTLAYGVSLWCGNDLKKR